MTDKKIEEYLERAIKITKLNRKYEDQWTEGALSRVVEIAKMIQLEEQHQDLLKLSRE